MRRSCKSNPRATTPMWYTAAAEYASKIRNSTEGSSKEETLTANSKDCRNQFSGRGQCLRTDRSWGSPSRIEASKVPASVKHFAPRIPTGESQHNPRAQSRISSNCLTKRNAYSFKQMASGKNSKEGPERFEGGLIKPNSRIGSRNPFLVATSSSKNSKFSRVSSRRDIQRKDVEIAFAGAAGNNLALEPEVTVDPMEVKPLIMVEPISKKADSQTAKEQPAGKSIDTKAAAITKANTTHLSNAENKSPDVSKSSKMSSNSFYSELQPLKSAQSVDKQIEERKDSLPKTTKTIFSSEPKIRPGDDLYVTPSRHTLCFPSELRFYPKPKIATDTDKSKSHISPEDGKDCETDDEVGAEEAMGCLSKCSLHQSGVDNGYLQTAQKTQHKSSDSFHIHAQENEMKLPKSYAVVEETYLSFNSSPNVALNAGDPNQTRSAPQHGITHYMCSGMASQLSCHSQMPWQPRVTISRHRCSHCRQHFHQYPLNPQSNYTNNRMHCNRSIHVFNQQQQQQQQQQQLQSYNQTLTTLLARQLQQQIEQHQTHDHEREQTDNLHTSTSSKCRFNLGPSSQLKDAIPLVEKKSKESIKSVRIEDNSKLTNKSDEGKCKQNECKHKSRGCQTNAAEIIPQNIGKTPVLHQQNQQPQHQLFCVFPHQQQYHPHQQYCQRHQLQSCPSQSHCNYYCNSRCQLCCAQMHFMMPHCWQRH